MRGTKRALVVVAFTLVSCSSQFIPAATPTSKSAVLRLYATTPVVPLIEELTTTYSQMYPTISFDIVSGNYETIVEQVLREKTAYFLSNHLPADSPLWAAPVGQDGIAVIVHPDNNIANLTTEQLRAIYQGRVANWDELGGQDAAIIVVSREDGSGTRAEYERLVMGERRTTPSAQVAPSSEAMVMSVRRQPGAVGYVSMSYLNPGVQSVDVDGIAPTLDNVYANAYPLRSTLFIIGMEEPEGDYRAFIGWVQSPEGQAVVAHKYAPLVRP